MSRAAVSKSRAEKGKPPASQTPVITQEIVPGKFNDNDWNVMLEKESAEDFVLDIVDEILARTEETIYNKYIERQILPFTITQAKDAILQIIEWRFLARDEGEISLETQAGWQQDEEPDPAVTDCWAQGSVPKKIVETAITPIPEVEEEVEPSPLEEVQGDDDTSKQEEVINDDLPELEDRVSDNDDEVEEDMTTTVETAPTPKISAKKKRKYKPHRGPLRSAGVSRMTESLEESEMNMLTKEIMTTFVQEEKSSGLITLPMSCHSILKVQAGRPPGNKDVTYDECGNVKSVVKIDPDRLPQHKVKVGYKIVDPTVEAAKARLEAMRHGRYVSSSKLVTKPSSNKPSKADVSIVSPSVNKSQKPQATIAPLPPPLIDAIDVASGVTVREGGKVRKGPGRLVRRVDLITDNEGLRPIATKISAPAIEVSDILDRHTPIIRQIRDTPPLPPIMPHPPVQ